MELVETSQDTSTSNTTENVCSGTLHHAHETLVLSSTTGGHHHPPPDCVNWVGHQASANSDSPSKEEGSSHGRVLSSDKHWLQGVKHSEVHATVDEDTNSRDGETSVQAPH